MLSDLYIAHHGIHGQKWGVRRYQNPDGTLTAAGQKRYLKADVKWAKKKGDKITSQAKRSVQRELNRYGDQLLQKDGAITKAGRLSSATLNAYNKKMAELMSTSVSSLRSPSGRTVKFVAKRGELGVMMALADEGYNMEQLKNGVWTSGRVAYKKTTLDKV